jgi:hypothetical protein
MLEAVAHAACDCGGERKVRRMAKPVRAMEFSVVPLLVIGLPPPPCAFTGHGASTAAIGRVLFEFHSASGPMNPV